MATRQIRAQPRPSPQFSHFRSPIPLRKSLVAQVLTLYDYQHPLKPGTTIEGYDKAHAHRTAGLCVMVAKKLGHPSERLQQYSIACLLHDIGRAGLDPPLFGKIWSWAKTQNIPTRPREWRAAYPHTPYGQETEAFIQKYQNDLKSLGIPLNEWTKEQIEMRLGFARRLTRQLRSAKPHIARMGIQWFPWMKDVMLYYYYPEKLERASRWVHQLAEILVACEQLEAYNNRRRGRDYYARSKESLKVGFEYLEHLCQEGIISADVLAIIRNLTTQPKFMSILTEARGKKFTKRELQNVHLFPKDTQLCQ